MFIFDINLSYDIYFKIDEHGKHLLNLANNDDLGALKHVSCGDVKITALSNLFQTPEAI